MSKNNNAGAPQGVERIEVKVSVPTAELEEIKQATGVDSAATAVLAAARAGKDLLTHMRSFATFSPTLPEEFRNADR